MRYAAIDAAGLPVGFYESVAQAERVGLHNTDDLIALTAAQYQECIGHPGRRRVVVDGDGKTSVEPYTPPPQPADQRRKAAKDAIDAAAGEARAAFVSVGWGVEEEYRLAKAETDAWIAAGKPADAVPPSVAVWAQARGWTAEQAAQDILDTEAAWMAALAAIRQARLLGKAAVDAAADDADFDAVAAPYIAQLAAIAEQAP